MVCHIYTTDNCIGCNKCIKVCPYLGASIIKIKNGIERVEVNPDACVTCGACRDVCRYNARQYDDDLNRLLEDLKKGFAVVASEINVLADNSKNTVVKSNESQENIQKIMEVVQQDIKQLLDIVYNVNERTIRLASASQTIAASTQNISAVSDKVRLELNNLKEDNRV